MLSKFAHGQDGGGIVDIAVGKTSDQRIICRADEDVVENFADVLPLTRGYESRCRPEGGDGQVEKIVDKVG